MKRILLLTTGGTIASVETAHGLAPAPTNEPLRRLLDELALPCKVDVKSLFHIDSTNFQPEHWLEIARAIRAAYGPSGSGTTSMTASSSATAPTPWPIRRRRSLTSFSIPPSPLC